MAVAALVAGAPTLGDGGWVPTVIVFDDRRIWAGFDSHMSPRGMGAERAEETRQDGLARRSATRIRCVDGGRLHWLSVQETNSGE